MFLQVFIARPRNDVVALPIDDRRPQLGRSLETTGDSGKRGCLALHVGQKLKVVFWFLMVFHDFGVFFFFFFGGGGLNVSGFDNGLYMGF